MVMDLESIECVSSSDGMDEDEIHHHHQQHHSLHHHVHSEYSSTKPRNNGGGTVNNNNNINVMGPTAISPATSSVHELLECPVCTNSMYPPIHQVSWLVSYFIGFCFYGFLLH